MILKGKQLKNLNTITHDGKVMLFGIAGDGKIYYAVKQSGFEDSAIYGTTENPGFENWKEVPLNDAQPDASVLAKEAAELTDVNQNRLLQSRYQGELATSPESSLQLISGMGHLYLFRQSVANTLLVNRFVLDGMTNLLVPKLEVRFKRSKQKHTASKNMKKTSKGLENVDSLGFKDMDGNPFYEPAKELKCINNLHQGWFSAVLLPTSESEKFRWHVFAYDSVAQQVKLYTIRASEEGLFDLKDYSIAEPTGSGQKIFRNISGIIERTLDLEGLTVAHAFSATVYHRQLEQQTPNGPQLIRDAVKVMLAVPVEKDSVVSTATISFSVAHDGTLSQIDKVPDSTELLKSNVRDILLPLNTLDEVKVIADSTPPPAGTVKAVEKATGDKVKITSLASFNGMLKAGDKVRIYGTQHYNGLHEVSGIDGNNFQIDVPFINDEAGFWEVMPDAEEGLIFDNMVVGYEKTAQGELKVLCTNHTLEQGDEVQIASTRGYNDIFTVKAVDDASNTFTLDIPWKAGEIIDLKSVKRRGIRFDGSGDYLKATELTISAPQRANPFARTLSGWIRVDSLANREQLLLAEQGGLMELMLGSDNIVVFRVRFSDGTTRTIRDTAVVDTGKWLHFAAVMEYNATGNGQTQLILYRNGEPVTPVAEAGETVSNNIKTISPDTPLHLSADTMYFDGSGDYIAISGYKGITGAGARTVEAWIKTTADNAAIAAWGTNTAAKKWVMCLQNVNGTPGALAVEVNGGHVVGSTAVNDGKWHHVACVLPEMTTPDVTDVKLYVDGVPETLSDTAAAPIDTASGVDVRLGTDQINRYFTGYLADVRLWSVARTGKQVQDARFQRITGTEPGLSGAWALDNGQAFDTSSGKNAGTVNGNPEVQLSGFVYPRPEVLTAAQFGGTDDAVLLPGMEPDLTNGLTLEAWVNPAALTANAVLAELGNGENSDNIILYLPDATGKAGIKVAQGDQFQSLETAAGVLVNDEWAHLAAVLTPDGKASLYKNGQLLKTGDVHAPGEMARTDNFLARGSAASTFFNGKLAEVRLWNKARNAKEIRNTLFMQLTASTPNLAGCWRFAGSQAGDHSGEALHGAYTGAPQTAEIPAPLEIDQWAPGFYMGGTGEDSAPDDYEGQLSDIRLWNRAQAYREIKDTMHLRLTGKEQNLVAYWRLGGIAREEGQKIVPDFSVNGHDAEGFGEVYVSARTLNRATNGGLKAVKYGNSALFAVSQRAVYEESFEFKVNTGNPDFDVNNADSQGNKLFDMAYWGKVSRNSEEKIAFPTANVQMQDFQDLGNGFYKATCRFTVPDGVNLVRTFELDDIRGVWAGEPNAPNTEWTGIDIRKHQVIQVSDAITRERYTDTLNLAEHTHAGADGETLLDNVQASEETVTQLVTEIQDLQERIDVLGDLVKYQEEKATLEMELTGLLTEKAGKENEINAFRNDFANYYQQIEGTSRRKNLCIYEDHFNNYKAYVDYKWTNDISERYSFDFIVKRVNQDYYHIISKSGQYLTYEYISHRNYFFYRKEELKDISFQTRSNDIDSQLWKIVYLPWGEVLLQSKKGFSDHYGDGDSFLTYSSENRLLTQTSRNQDSAGSWGHVHFYKKWRFLQIGTMHPEASAVLQQKQDTLAGLIAKVNDKQNRIARLAALLKTDDDLTVLQAQLAEAQTALNQAWVDFNTHNTTFLDYAGQVQNSPQTLSLVSRDNRALDTYGALIGFIKPAGRLGARESVEGEVQLSYVDSKNRLRLTRYDATADSRNAAFEQWIPESLRACPECRDTADKITLESPLKLSDSQWTIEAWWHYPGPVQNDGSPYLYQFLAATEDGLSAPLVIKNGKRLGSLTEGIFQDSGYALDSRLPKGWHHVAAIAQNGGTRYYIDGRRIDAIQDPLAMVKYNLQFRGEEDAVVFSDFQSFPTTQFTVACWVKTHSDTAGVLVSYNVSGNDEQLVISNPANLQITVKGLACNATNVAVNDGKWHHIALTWENQTGKLVLYKDGQLVYSQLGFRTGQSLTSGGTLVFGRGQDTAGGDPETTRAFNGWLGALSLWNKVRSQVNIEMNMYNALQGDEDGLAGYWKMEVVMEEGVMVLPDSLVDADAQHTGAVQGNPLPHSIAPVCKGELTTLGNAPGGGAPAGRMAELRIWDVALGEEALQANSKVLLTGNEPGLVSYYPLAEASGTQVRDHAPGKPVTGTIAGAGWVACTARIGDLGTYALQTGENSYMDAGNSMDLKDKDLTIEFWAKRDATGSDHYAIGREVNQGKGLHIGFKADNTLTFAHDGIGVTTPGAYTDTDWHHYACAYDNTNRHCTVYRDGEQLARDAEPVPVPGSIRSLVFNGTDNALRGGSGINLANRSFTIECWVRRTGFSTANWIVGQGVALDNQMLSIGFRDDTFLFSFHTNNEVSTPDTYTDTHWHHWACTYDAATKQRTIYCDGRQVAQDNAAAHYQGTGDFRIGNNALDAGYFKGELAELRIWDHPRSIDEIQEHKNEMLTGQESGLTAYWPFEGAVARRVIEQSGNHGPATVYGSDPMQVPGPVADTNALELDGVDNCVDAGLGIDLKAKSFTVECWVRRNVPGTYGMICLQGPAGIANHRLHIGFRSNNRFTFDFLYNGLDTPDTYTDTNWHHWACTYNAANKQRTIYRDGQQVAQGISPEHFLGTGNFVIGNSIGGLFNGGLADFRVWDHVRSQNNIQQYKDTALTGQEAGLLGYWKLDAVTGDQIGDRSGNTHHAEVQGAPMSLGISPVGDAIALDLNGTTNWVDCGTSIDLASRSFTVECWARRADNVYVDWILMKGVHETNKGLHIGFRDTNVFTFAFYHNDLDTPVAYPDNDWHHWACTYNAATKQRTIYRDGQPVAQDTALEHYLGTGTIQLGRSTGGDHFHGGLTEVRIWDHVRTIEQIQQNKDSMLNGREEGLLGYWSFDASNSAQVTDLSGNGNTGTIHGPVQKSPVEFVTGPIEYGKFWLGRAQLEGAFQGAVARVRVWEKLLDQATIQKNRFRPVTAIEQGLLAHWDFSPANSREVTDISSNNQTGTIKGPVQKVNCEPFHIREAVACEYSRVGIDPYDPTKKLATMERFHAWPTVVGTIQVLPGQVIETLVLKWIGNAQFQPTLLGYIEGAPPAPSENFTEDNDYAGATSVQLTQSQDVGYTWNRTKDTSQGLDLDLFVGAAWDVTAGIGVESALTEGKVGLKGALNMRFGESKSSTVSAESSINLADSLELRGHQEQQARFAHLGKRFVPKNVGYALVVSGMADVFVVSLRRSGRMVGYEIRPVEGIPPDVNTITFMMNPTYTLNGSLDGLVGSNAADDRFFGHVPEMRAQFGSLYPASYFRLKEAYELKEMIDRQDADRQAYFNNFDVSKVDPARAKDLDKQAGVDTGDVNAPDEQEDSDDPNKTEEEKQKEKQKAAKSQSKEQGKEIEAQSESQKGKLEGSLDNQKQAEAMAGLDTWQRRMEGLQIRAGKRNIVNTYIWDADGGLRAEEQNFASTVEHSIGSSFTIGGNIGAQVELQAGNFALELTALYAGEMTQTMTKTQSTGTGFELKVDLSGLEHRGITDSQDYPLNPGEKVDRFRMMSFYLEGDTRHFNEFFEKVVDPEWLMSNDEEARTLRLMQAGKPNKAWRVLHRVTYVERPALMGFGRTVASGPDQAENAVNAYFNELEAKQQLLQSRMESMELKLDQIINALGGS